MRQFLATLIVLAAVVTLHAQAPPARTAADLAKLGPQVGDRVPDFRLQDQAGATRDLKSILGPNGGMLVFFRSADW
jgi:hypothetical protein